MTIDEQFEKLENTVREYNPGADFKRIRESYEFAKQHHGEQRRKSGELYITHPLAVAQIVAEELHLDSESIERLCSTTPSRIPPPPTRTSPGSSLPRWRIWWRASAS
mgnify:CR=1 FL=1